MRLLFNISLIGLFSLISMNGYGAQVDVPIIVNDLFLQTKVQIAEPSTGGVGPLTGAFGLKSQFVSWADIKMVVGTTDQLSRPNWSPTSSETVSLLDAVGTLHSMIGDFYAGQFTTVWGLDGTMSTKELWIPRTLLFSRGYFPRRDIGVGFKTEYDGYYMNIMTHNGEGAGLSNTDNRMFLTGQWGYLGPANLKIGISGTAGRVFSQTTGLETKVRGANAFFGFHIFGLGFQLEGSLINYLSDASNQDVLAWHGDLEHPITDNFNLIGRYEQLNPNSRIQTNIIGKGYLGGEYHSKDNVSRLFLYFVKNNDSLQETPNDEVQIIWRLAPPL